MKGLKRFCASLGVCLVLSSQANGAVINLNTWSSPDTGGSWTVAPDGESVFQSTNGNPTVFLSPTNVFNDNIRGSVTVETTSDDDYIGFIFGWQSTTNFYLFDWKQGLQSGSPAGFTLSHVTTAGLSGVPFSNHQTSSTGYNVLDTNNSFGGWADNTLYEFTVAYNASSIVVSVLGGAFTTGTNVLSTTGSFSSGKFGFFNFSQSGVRYSGFEEDAPPPVGASAPSALSILLLALGALVFRNRRAG
jgi:hypothetical protein